MILFSKDQRLFKAVDYANKYFQSDDFKNDVLSVSSFYLANVSPQEILELFGKFNLKVEIVSTYFGFFYKRVLGRTIGDGKAYINSSSLNRALQSVSATVVHETSHVVDEFFPDAYWGHGDNSSNGKGATFSYFIGARAERWILREILKDQVEQISFEIIQDQQKGKLWMTYAQSKMNLNKV